MVEKPTKDELKDARRKVVRRSRREFLAAFGVVYGLAVIYTVGLGFNGTGDHPELAFTATWLLVSGGVVGLTWAYLVTVGWWRRRVTEEIELAKWSRFMLDTGPLPELPLVNARVKMPDGHWEICSRVQVDSAQIRIRMFEKGIKAKLDPGDVCVAYMNRDYVA